VEEQAEDADDKEKDTDPTEEGWLRWRTPSSRALILIHRLTYEYLTKPSLLFRSIMMSTSVCVCLYACPRGYLPYHTRSLYQTFVHDVAYGRGSVLHRRGDKIARGMGNFGGFLADVNSHSRSLYAIADPSVCRLSVCDVGAPYSAG